MKLHDFRFAPLAERDLETIQDVLADQYPDRDIRFMAKLDKTIELIRGFPAMGRKFAPATNYRIVVIWDFFMFYRVEGRLIIIERVIHGARDIEATFFDD